MDCFAAFIGVGVCSLWFVLGVCGLFPVGFVGV